MAGSGQVRVMSRRAAFFEPARKTSFGRQRIHCDRPYEGDLAAKLYVGDSETSILFRHTKVTSPLFYQCVDRSVVDASVAEVAATATEIEYELPAADLDAVKWYQVRTHAADYQNETIYRPRRLRTDSGGDAEDKIFGVANYDASEKRDDGVVRIYFTYFERRDGLQPDQFRVVKTAGVPTVADVVVSASGGGQYYADIEGMAEAETATFRVDAENGSVVKTLLTGIQLTAHAIGPNGTITVGYEAVE